MKLKMDNSDCDPQKITSEAKTQTTQKRRAGRKKLQETRNGSWVRELQESNKKSRIELGDCESPDMEARAYAAAAALSLRGDSASLNFPEAARAKPGKPTVMWAAAEKVEECSKPCPWIDSSSSSAAGEVDDQELCGRNKKLVYVDEEEVFNMPGIIDSMAEALMLTPPAMKNGLKYWDDDATPAEFTLWGD